MTRRENSPSNYTKILLTRGNNNRADPHGEALLLFPLQWRLRLGVLLPPRSCWTFSAFLSPSAHGEVPPAQDYCGWYSQRLPCRLDPSNRHDQWHSKLSVLLHTEETNLAVLNLSVLLEGHLLRVTLNYHQDPIGDQHMNSYFSITVSKYIENYLFGV